MITSPFREAVRLSLSTIASALFTVVALDLDGLVSVQHETLFYLLVALALIPVVGMAFAFTYLGSVVGRRRAHFIVKAAVAAIVLSVLIVVAVRTLLNS